ncbi:trimeric intracellular cation channel family protein [Bartonella apihabitans]|uniref:trimeric intracellular cation channel family protein n=1 Tax=uncultured Bartonella sp. TaxID=104108 RepID=UPI0025F8FD76|nr:trimeric intracellular cation channel family protein [Bartonella apihabitans]WLT08660.1 trimeric intracellular cation channel family protein [Bartonella apihabitans]
MLLHSIDVIGTFVFALSGTSAGIRRGFDFFGVFVVAMATACGGGIMRDLCLGATPPVGLTNIEYFIAIIGAVLLGIFCQGLIIRMEKPTLWLDALGLGFFAAFGSDKAYQLTGNIQIAIILGCASAVGGGCVRDILTGRTPIIFSKEIYASASIVGSAIVLLGSARLISPVIAIWTAIAVCTFIRIVSIHYQINLPPITLKTPNRPK